MATDSRHGALDGCGVNSGCCRDGVDGDRRQPPTLAGSYRTLTHRHLESSGGTTLEKVTRWQINFWFGVGAM